MENLEKGNAEKAIEPSPAQRILELKANAYDLSVMRMQREAAAIQELKNIDQELQHINAQIYELQKTA